MAVTARTGLRCLCLLALSMRVPFLGWGGSRDFEVDLGSPGQILLSSITPTPAPAPAQGKESKEVKDETSEERLRRRAYERGCQRLKKRIEGRPPCLGTG